MDTEADAEAEPWEALALELDLEDSHLIPCKRKDSISPTRINKTFKSSSNQFLGPSSQTRLIPGPARAVQSAMQHKISMSVGVGDEPVSTQELIRRAVEDPGLEDKDFVCNPWLFAVDFVRSQGLVGDDGVAIGTPLILINNRFNADRVPQIVAIVKSTTPNGLGDMMATLKDPTGTIDASIHRRVLTEGEFGKDISVGAVLILHKVAVFSPSRSACYLNITVSNIVKVISKDTETPLRPNYPSLTAKHACADGESGEKSWMPNKTSSQSQGQVDGIMNSQRRNASMRGSVQNTKQMEKVILSPPCCFHGAVGDNQNSVVGKEPLVHGQDILEGLKVVVGTGTNYNDIENLLDEQPHPSNQSTRTGIMNCFRPNANVRGSVHNTEQLGNINSAPPSSFGGDGGCRIQSSVVEKEPIVVTQNIDRTKVAVGTGTCGKDRSILIGNQLKPSNQAVRCNLREVQCESDAANFVQVPRNNEDGNAEGVKNHSQLLISKSSLSQWTDEQLDELLLF